MPECKLKTASAVRSNFSFKYVLENEGVYKPDFGDTGVRLVTIKLGLRTYTTFYWKGSFFGKCYQSAWGHRRFLRLDEQFSITISNNEFDRTA